MTPFQLLYRLAGLPLRETARVLNVRQDSANAWSSGKHAPPEGVIVELVDLIRKQEFGAASMVAQINAYRQQYGGEAFDLGFPADDEEAQAIGWASVGAWSGMAARVIATAPVAVRLVPRATTAPVRPQPSSGLKWAQKTGE